MFRWFWHKVRGCNGPQQEECVVGVWVGYNTHHFLAAPYKCSYCGNLYTKSNDGHKTHVEWITTKREWERDRAAAYEAVFYQ